MFSRLPIKRHDDVVHDVDEVWRSLRRTMLLLRSGDKVQAAAALRFTVGIFNFVDDIDMVTAAHMCTVFAELFQILEDFSESDRFYVEAYNSIVKKYGVGHLAIGDYYMMMAAVRAKQGRVNDAIDCSGKALIIRMRSLGLVHDKVADCHFNLGLLYRLSGDMQNSLKHFKICRGIKRNLFLERSKEVAFVDISLGQTEQWMVMYDKAYYSFYNSYRTYCIWCGVASDEAIVVLEYVKQLRFSHGARFTSLVELQDIVSALDYEYKCPHSLRKDVFIQAMLRSIEHGQKLVVTGLELKYIILSVLADGQFDHAESHFLCRVSKSGATDQVLTDCVYTELIQPISDKSMSLIFENEWRAVSAEQEKLKDKFVGVQSVATTITNQESVPKHQLSRKEPVVAASGAISTPTQNRTKSVHFSPEYNEVHVINSSEGSPTARNSDVEDTSAVSVMDDGEDSVGFYDDIYDPDENVDVVDNIANPMRRKSVDNQNSISRQKRNQAGQKQSFFVRAEQSHALPVQAEEESSVISEPSPPPSPSDFDWELPDPDYPPSPETPDVADGPPTECNFRLGTRSLLILQDGDGKAVSIRPVKEEDVIAALKPKLFAFSSFIYLLQQSEKEAELAAERALAAAAGPVAARDNSKPLDQAPLPPPLPVGWPPRPPTEEFDDGMPRPQTSLSALFKGATPQNPSERKRSSVTPTLKLKQVHWDTVMLPTTEGTVWDTGSFDRPDDLSVVDHTIMFPDLIADFEITKVGALSKTNVPAVLSTPKKVMKNILDPKRSQNITIMLSKFRKIPPAAITQAVLELDTSAIEQSVIQGMLDQVPTPEEQRAVKKYYEEHNEDTSKLDKAEHYVLETIKVPMMQARLNLMLILSSLDDAVHTVESSTKLIFTSTAELQGSARYRRLMHVILTVGNLLNKGSKKSSAVGFRLSSLSKLMQTKSNTGVSLVEYVVGHLLKQEPDVLDIASEFSCLQEAKQTSFVALSAEVAKLSVGISIGYRITESTDNDESMREITANIRKGVENINSTVKKLEGLCEDAVHRFNTTCTYLGEPVSDPGTLFGQLIALLECITKSTKEVQAKMKKSASTVKATSLKGVFGSPMPEEKSC